MVQEVTISLNLDTSPFKSQLASVQSQLQGLSAPVMKASKTTFKVDAFENALKGIEKMFDLPTLKVGGARVGEADKTVAVAEKTVAYGAAMVKGSMSSFNLLGLIKGLLTLPPPILAAILVGIGVVVVLISAVQTALKPILMVLGAIGRVLGAALMPISMVIVGWLLPILSSFNRNQNNLQKLLLAGIFVIFTSVLGLAVNLLLGSSGLIVQGIARVYSGIISLINYFFQIGANKPEEKMWFQTFTENVEKEAENVGKVTDTFYKNATASVAKNLGDQNKTVQEAVDEWVSGSKKVKDSLKVTSSEIATNAAKFGSEMEGPIASFQDSAIACFETINTSIKPPLDAISGNVLACFETIKTESEKLYSSIQPKEPADSGFIFAGSEYSKSLTAQREAMFPSESSGGGGARTINVNTTVYGYAGDSFVDELASKVGLRIRANTG